MRFGPPLFWLGVSLWVGGLAALALSAPTIFRTAPSRESAGLIFGNILRSFSRVEIACALLCGAGMVLAWSRPAAAIDQVRAGLLGVMVALLIVLQAWIVPSLESLRPQVATSETVRVQFQKRHQLSELLYKAELLAGLSLIVISAWSTHRRP